MAQRLAYEATTAAAHRGTYPHDEPGSECIYPWRVSRGYIVADAPGHPYRIPIADLRDPAQGALWYWHMAAKRWANGITLWGLRRAIDRYAAGGDR